MATAFERSQDGQRFSQMRVCHMWEGRRQRPLRHLRLQPDELMQQRHSSVHWSARPTSWNQTAHFTTSYSQLLLQMTGFDK